MLSWEPVVSDQTSRQLGACQLDPKKGVLVCCQAWVSGVPPHTAGEGALCTSLHRL
jgi:hypothetical protein